MPSEFRSLEDFLVSKPLTVDAEIDDGWGTPFPVKGREIEAAVLFADITAFSTRTADLSPVETLIFVNNFFTWISAEALRGGNGIVDKYIGDEMMLVFSQEFGADDPFVEAVRAARWMGQNDALGFYPHIGIASGRVIVGYAGTPLKYNCSVFGTPVTIAARCAGVKVEADTPVGATVVFPAEEWRDRLLTDVLEPERFQAPDGSVAEHPLDWQLREAREVTVKNTTLRVRELVRTGVWLPGPGASGDHRAREAFAGLRRAGLYRPVPFTDRPVVPGPNTEQT